MRRHTSDAAGERGGTKALLRGGFSPRLGFLNLCLLILLPVRADCPPCGPLYCTDTHEYSVALAAKKQSLAAHGYTARMIAILDKLGHCVGCVSTAPDAFSLLTVTPEGKLTIDGWDADNERIGANQLASGQLKACYVIYVRHACACCQENSYSARSDYNPQLDLNTDMAIACSADSADLAKRKRIPKPPVLKPPTTDSSHRAAASPS
jgi:hypothetical protein